MRAICQTILSDHWSSISYRREDVGPYFQSPKANRCIWWMWPSEYIRKCARCSCSTTSVAKGVEYHPNHSPCRHISVLQAYVNLNVYSTVNTSMLLHFFYSMLLLFMHDIRISYDLLLHIITVDMTLVWSQQLITLLIIQVRHLCWAVFLLFSSNLCSCQLCWE